MKIKLSSFYILFFIFINVFLAVVSIQTCPPEDRITPCKCEKVCDDCRVSLKCNNLQEFGILPQIINRTNGYEYDTFEIKRSNITHIPASLFEAHKITNLKIWSTAMTSLFDHPPATDLPDVYIFLYEAALPSMQWEMLSGIQNLGRLSIRHSLIPSFDTSFSNNVPKNLEELVVYDCSTETLEDHVFSTFEKLLELRMDGMKIKVLKRSMFASPAKLQLISFSFNEIETLPSDIFSDMPDLENIYLRGNRLSQLDESIFRPLLPRLEAFKVSAYFVSENPLMCGCNMRWITEIERSQWTNLYYVGDCEEPNELKGKPLKDLDANDFAHCS
ncbi:hypothetical protein TNCT_23402 [Trichonephila clavata]|uniref:LRRCT domain-containing protein n=1 Tax=Trichonephila clavata TaxID=2740835 RepID=A0A8X6JLB2_TRICU|nr:hypothetical protein TNCT_23402 [Trichonephila clavata]